MRQPKIIVDVSHLVCPSTFYMIGQRTLGRDLSALERRAIDALGLFEKVDPILGYDHREHAELIMLTMIELSTDPIDDLFIVCSTNQARQSDVA
jgi:hypothetical protein